MAADFDRFAVGTAASLTEVVTGDRIAATAQLTGDDNPIHVDAAQARVFGQSQPIAHGVILLGLVSRLIGTRLPGPGSIWFDSQFEFLAPVYAGDEVRVTARVAQVSPATRVVVLDVEATKTGDAMVLRGRAKVRVPLPSNESTSVMNDPTRTAIVTGASRGIGRAVAERLGASGWRVVVNYRTDRSGAEACIATIGERGGTAVAIAADLAGDAKRLFDESQKAFGRVDAIVHCATPSIARKSWLETSSDEFRGYFETFVIGLHELAALAVPGMKERRAGHIVSVLSSAIAEVPPNLSAYTTGKAALLALTRSLAVELGPSNIRVNAVTPSLVLGPQTDALGPAVREGAARRTPLRRLANATDVADAVLFLLDDRASFVSGANLPVTGGLVI